MIHDDSDRLWFDNVLGYAAVCFGVCFAGSALGMLCESVLQDLSSKNGPPRK